MVARPRREMVQGAWSRSEAQPMRGVAMVKGMVRIKTMVTMGMSIEMMRRNPRFENGIPGFA